MAQAHPATHPRPDMARHGRVISAQQFPCQLPVDSPLLTSFGFALLTHVHVPHIGGARWQVQVASRGHPVPLRTYSTRHKKWWPRTATLTDDTHPIVQSLCYLVPSPQVEEREVSGECPVHPCESVPQRQVPRATSRGRFWPFGWLRLQRPTQSPREPFFLRRTERTQDTFFAIPEFQHDSPDELQDPSLYKFHPSFYDRTWVGKVIAFFTADVRTSQNDYQHETRLAFVHWAETYVDKPGQSASVCRMPE